MYRKKDCNYCKEKNMTNINLKHLYTDFVHCMKGSSIKCSICIILLANHKEVVNHTINEHEAKKFMKNTFNMRMCA